MGSPVQRPVSKRSARRLTRAAGVAARCRALPQRAVMNRYALSIIALSQSKPVSRSTAARCRSNSARTDGGSRSRFSSGASPSSSLRAANSGAAPTASAAGATASRSARTAAAQMPVYGKTDETHFSCATRTAASVSARIPLFRSAETAMQGTSSAAEKAAVSMCPPPARISSAILKATTVGSPRLRSCSVRYSPRSAAVQSMMLITASGRSSVRKSRVTSSSAE